MLNFEINLYFWKIRIWKLFSIYGKSEFEIFYFVINYLITTGKIFDLPNCPILLDTCMRQIFNKINVGRQMEQPR
jgi:hypothetical protein